ncbi:MAG: M48 family metallopeptidase [Leptospirales bacterium]|jgi:STE24 endopeptidase
MQTIDSPQCRSLEKRPEIFANRYKPPGASRLLCRLAPVLAWLLYAGALTPLAAETVAVPEPSAETLRYYHSGNILWLINVALGFLIPLVILFSGLSARIRNLAAALAGRVGFGAWLFTILFYFVLFSLLNFLITLPLDYYQGFVRGHEYGLSNQSFSKWIGDLLRGQAVGLLIGVAVIWLPYLLVKKAPRTWWVWSGLAAVPFTILLMLITPVWISPLFNDFGPMRDKQLEHKILALADRTGIEGGRVYEVNKSVDTKTVNAYVTGFGDSKRIVLWDTLLVKLSSEQVLFVMGHEMGHYVLEHVLHGIVFACLGAFGALFAAHSLAGWLIGRFQYRFGFSELSDVASLPLVLLIISLVSFAARPAMLAYSRHNEHEADRFALELTRDNLAGATAFAKLQAENLAHPRPDDWVKWLRFAHPPLGERIEFCNNYRPWETGEPPRYAHLFDHRHEGRR